MRKRKKQRRPLADLLTLCLLLTLLPVSALAGRDAVAVAAFDAPEPGEITVPYGTAEEALPLPAALTGRTVPASAEPSADPEIVLPEGAPAEGGAAAGNGGVAPGEAVGGPEETAIAPVVWTAEPAYAPETPGDYVFTASAPGYVCAEGASWPTVTVTVASPPEPVPAPEPVSPPEPDAVDGLCAAIDGLPDVETLYETMLPDSAPGFPAWAAEARALLADVPDLWERLTALDEAGRARVGEDRARKLEDLDALSERLEEAESLAEGAVSESQTWSGSINSAVTITGGTAEDPVVITVSETVTASAPITVSGHARFIGGAIQWTQPYLTNAFVVNQGASAVLENITLDGNGETFSRSALLIRGTATLGAGATVQNFTSSGTGGAGAGNKGVIAVYGGTLNIGDGAVITGNQSSSGIIALYDQDAPNKTDSNAKMVMTGGTIFGNTVRSPGSTSNMGVIWNWTGALEISGGSVTAEGIEYAVYTQGNHGSNGDYAAHTAISGGSFSGAQTGAVCAGKGDNVEYPASTTTTINGGAFTGESAAAVRDGTIDVQGGTFNGTSYALDVGAGDIRVSGGAFFGEATAYQGGVTTLTQEVIVGTEADGKSAEDWDRSTSLNTYRYVAIGSAYTKPHAYHYSADGAVVTGSCAGCSREGTATLIIPEGASLVYTGGAIQPATIVYSDGWVGRRDAGIAYTGNVNAGTATATAVVGGQSISLSFSIQKAQNSVTGLSCADVPYGGAPEPTANAAFGTPAYSYSNTESGPYSPWQTTNGAGVWYVKAAVAETANYAGAEKVSSFQVTAAEMTGISAGGYTGHYDGKPHGIAVTGVPGGAAVEYSLTDGGGWSAAQPEIIDAAGGVTVYYKVSLANYADFTGSATVTITPKAIAAVWGSAASWIYNGQPHVPAATAETGVAGETVALAVSGGKTDAGGPYTAMASISAVTGGRGTPANYTLTNGTVGFTIAKAPVTFAVTDNAHGYDAQAKTATVSQTADETPDLGGCFTVGYRQNGGVVAAPTAVGEYEVWVTLGSENFRFAGEADAVRSKQAGTLTISGAAYPNAETMTWPTAEGLTYGAKLSASALSGGSEAGNGSYAWKLPDTIPTVSNAGCTVVFTPNDANYSPAERTVPVPVAPKELTVSGAEAKSRAYAPGNTAVTVSGGALEGVVSRNGTPDAVSLDGSGAAGTVETPDAGDGKPVAVTGYILTGADNENYTLKQPTGLTADIAPAAGAASVSMEGWTYGGAANSPVPVSATNGTGSVVYRYTGAKLDESPYDSADAPTDAGTYTVAAVFAATQNYRESTATADFAIAPKPIMVQWTKTSHIYDGTAKSSVLALVGLEASDKNDVSAVLPGGGKTEAGNYAVSASLMGTRAFNYLLTNPAGTLTVQKAPVTFTVSEGTEAYDGQAKAAAVTATANGGSFTGFTVVYKTGAGLAVAAPTEAGSYEIWAELTNDNYRHADSTGGQSRKIGVLTIYQNTPPAKYAVSFAPGEGASGSTDTLGEALAGTLRVLPECGFTRTGFAFTGWELDGRIYQPGQTVEQPMENLIFTARWAAVRTIGGTVTQENRVAPGAVVTLMRGARYIADTVTDENGRFQFQGVAPDLYNLVGSRNGVIMTIKAEVSSADMDDAVIALPKARTNSVVEVLAGTPEVIVGNLEAAISADNPQVYTEEDGAVVAAGGAVVAAGGAVELKLTVRALEGVKAAEAQTAIAAQDAGAAQTVGLYLDLSLQKTVAAVGETPAIKSLPASGSILLESVLPLPAELQGKYGYMVYRLHDPDGEGPEPLTLDTLTETKNQAGEYIEVNAEKTALTIHAKNYSVYAVAWTDAPGGPPDSPSSGQDKPSGSSSGGDGAPSVRPPTVAKPEHGTVEVAPSRPAKGETVVISPKPDQAYRPGAVSVTDEAGRALPVTDNGDGTWSYTQPAGGVTITVTFVPENSDRPAWNPFTDVENGDWFCDGVKYVYERGLMNGTAADRFSPGADTTRGMIVTILWRLEGAPESKTAMPFGDVKAGGYCFEAVRWGAEHGIVKGYTETTFCPNKAITRQELAAILYRYAQYKGRDLSASDELAAFTDQPDPWAAEAVRWAVGEGILTGKGGGLLDPRGKATRAQAAVMLTRFAAAKAN